MKKRWEAGKGGHGRAAQLRHFSAAFMFLFLVITTANAIAQTNFDDLRTKLAVGSAEEKRSALFYIRGLHTEEASRLAIPSLSDRLDIVRATAALSVIFLPSGEAVKLLLPLLNDKAEFVRRETAFALGEVGSSLAVPELIKNLQKENAVENRSAAAMALGKLGEASAVEPLLAILKNKPLESEEFVRSSAAKSIGQIVQTIRFGQHQTLTPQNFLPEKYKEKIAPLDSKPQQAPQAFSFAIPTLSKVVENSRESDDTRRGAAFALGAIGSSESVQLLKSHSSSQDYYLAEICKEALLGFPPAN
jgi:HEAT repeat protein